MINEISVLNLKEKLERKKIVLLDVREDDEVKICSIKESVHVPMKNIPKILHKLRKDTDYAIICHSGVRSYNVAFYLQNNGFNVFNVAGGIDMWASEIEQTMNRY